MLKYRRFLTDAAEQLVLQHRIAVQTRKADDLKNQMKALKRYELMNKHLDEMIEEDILYFNAKINDESSIQFSSVKAAYR